MEPDPGEGAELAMLISPIVTFNLTSIGGAWKLLLVTGAGTGTVLLLRWFWWRINAWSEVSAMTVAAATLISWNLPATLAGNRK